MRINTLSKKQLLALFLILGLLTGLAAAFYSAQHPQELRKKAAGTGDIRISLSPSIVNIRPGQSVTETIQMVNVSGTDKYITVAGFDTQFDSNFFSLTPVNMSCGTDLPVPASRLVVTPTPGGVIDGLLTAKLTCFVGGGAASITVPANGTPVIMGTITFTALNNDANVGSNTAITVVRTSIPDAAGTTDLSNAGSGATFTIVANPSNTPIPATPTRTPTPPTLTFTPTPTRTPTPTPLLPTAQFTSVCSAVQTPGSVSYDLSVKNISAGTFNSSTFFLSFSMNSTTKLIRDYLGTSTWEAGYPASGTWFGYILYRCLAPACNPVSGSVNFTLNGPKLISNTGKTLDTFMQWVAANLPSGYQIGVGANLVVDGRQNDSIGEAGLLIIPNACLPPTPTPTRTLTLTPTPTLTGTPTPTLTGTPAPTTTGIPPTPTNTPLPSSTATPTPTNTPAGTITPTPTYAQSQYTIDIGTMDSLTITISGAGTTPTITPVESPTPTTSPTPTPTIDPNAPQIDIQAALADVQNYPDLYFRLRVKDDLYFLNNPIASAAATCQTAGPGQKDYYLPMKGDSQTGSYYAVPASQVSVQPPSGVHVAQITDIGNIVLDGLAPDTYYTFILKAPKTRGAKTATHVRLIKGYSSNQVFNWVSQPLDPGDLPDPNNNNLQDCTVNVIDLSLIESRIGTTDQTSLDIADVNYDGVVNGNDISKVVNTLSTKPDDD